MKVPRIAILTIALALFAGCSKDKSTESKPSPPPEPICTSTDTLRQDDHTPQSMVADWGTPIRIGEPVNTPCPQDAIEISGDGEWLYVLYTEDLLDSMTPDRMLARENNTYRSHRIGGPGDFDEPEYYDLGKGTDGSLDGECSFAGDSLVYFHSLRAENTGFVLDSTIDILDIYVAELTSGIPGAGRNLGVPPNSVYPDGEEAIHPDGISLYFGSTRPGGHGDVDIWESQWNGTNWSASVNLGNAINSLFKDYQPTFTADGDTMYFTSLRNPLIGAAIYRSARSGGVWGTPELVMQGIVGEPTLTDDGQLMYFVHVLSDGVGNYDADVWYSERVSP